jgi:hypothetical protein
MNNAIQIYQSPDGQMQLDVQMDNQTVWLNRQQMAILFDRDIKTIGKHINNVFEEGELTENSVVAKFATTAADGKTYQVEFYNLDVIISVGYRVKSQRGTQFRQWATARLKDFLVKGYAINQKRLDELAQMVSIIQQTSETDNLQLSEAKGVLNVLSNYTQSYVLLNQFDSHSLLTENLNENITYEIQYEGTVGGTKQSRRQRFDD